MTTSQNDNTHQAASTTPSHRFEGNLSRSDVLAERHLPLDDINEVGKIILYFNPRMKKLTGLGTLVTGPSHEAIEKDCFAGEDERGGLIPVSGEMFELMDNFVHAFCGLVYSANVKVMAHPLAGASIERGVEVEIRWGHGKQRG